MRAYTSWPSLAHHARHAPIHAMLKKAPLCTSYFRLLIVVYLPKYDKGVTRTHAYLLISDAKWCGSALLARGVLAKLPTVQIVPPFLGPLRRGVGANSNGGVTAS